MKFLLVKVKYTSLEPEKHQDQRQIQRKHLHVYSIGRQEIRSGVVLYIKKKRAPKTDFYTANNKNTSANNILLYHGKIYLSSHGQPILSFIHSVFIEFKIDSGHYAENCKKFKIYHILTLIFKGSGSKPIQIKD